MLPQHRSQDDALRGFRESSESSPISKLKKYMWNSKQQDLPFSYKDAQQTKVQANGGFMSSWPSWGFGTEAPWYDTMGMSRTQRYMAFGLCLLAVGLLFMLAMMHLPFIVVRPSKFVVPYCLASLFLFLSFGFLHGFWSYGKHLVSAERWPFTALFAGSTVCTLWVAMALRIYLLTVPLAVIQFISMIIYAISYLPGGASGVSMMGSVVRSSFFG